MTKKKKKSSTASLAFQRAHKMAPDICYLRFFATWAVHIPGRSRSRDHKGGRDSVEQTHCTPGVVKRYRDSHELASGIISS